MKRLFMLAAACLIASPAFAQYPQQADPHRGAVPGRFGHRHGRPHPGAVGVRGGRQPVVVDNKAGADGAIAGAEVAKSAPDGYTLLMATNSPMAVAPAMKKVPPYDPVADFTPITDVGRYTFFLYVYAEEPYKSFREMVAYAKANPGKINYATGNTTGIMSFGQMNALAGVEMTHVPYKGANRRRSPISLPVACSCCGRRRRRDFRTSRKASCARWPPT